MDTILPYDIYSVIKTLKYSGIYELRLRADKPCVINYFNNLYYLSRSGLTDKKTEAIICDIQDIQNVINSASNYSLYAINEQLKSGFITINGGVRIGIVGQVVTENNQIVTLKNFSGLNIRFPHQVKGSADKVIDYLLDGEDFLNTLIISPAGIGKTTLLRDIIRQLSGYYNKNILVIDERNEISSTVNGVMQMDLGDFCDVIVASTKFDGFVNGIRSMCPNIIATDEIGSKQDVLALEYACTCGVNIVATIHAKNLEQFLQKEDMKTLIANKAFKRYIILSNMKGKGTVENIYDENLTLIFKGA